MLFILICLFVMKNISNIPNISLFWSNINLISALFVLTKTIL